MAADARRTHSAIVSASFRQGMTTETRGFAARRRSRSVSSGAGRISVVRVCIVYDCLYPYTVGGAERWYRNLAERLASGGHEVTFLTRRQWQRDEEAEVPGVRVLAVSPRMRLYNRKGRRRILPPLLFGLGVVLHLLRRRGRYDVVHTASFPYFSLLAARAARRRGRYRILVDWHEVWTRDYWRDYLGGLRGAIGWRVQRACLRVPQRAFCFSRLHERRLHDLGLNGHLTRLEGQYAGTSGAAARQPARPVVVFAGRHIPEKRVAALVPAVARAREEIPELRAEIYGDGPQRPDVLHSIAALRAGEYISAPGFVGAEVLERALPMALCFVLPSKREGYGLVIVESSARGVPAVVVAGPDNAATELVDDGVNGVVAGSVDDLADAIVRIHRAGSQLRRSTLEWFERNEERLSLTRSLETVMQEYRESAHTPATSVAPRRPS
jgi:glycosyltransferase involved in cell wall biosynthesis